MMTLLFFMDPTEMTPMELLQQESLNIQVCGYDENWDQQVDECFFPVLYLMSGGPL